MDLVIPYRGKGDSGECIKYALRSAALNLDFDEVWILGDQPVTLDASSYNYIQVKDEPHGIHREKNMFVKILTACLEDKVSDDFIYFHDDHFINWPYQFEIPNFYSISFSGNTMYQNTVKNTKRVYPNAKNFDVHFPIVFNKDLFLNSVALLDWKVPYGYCIKTMYCEANKIKGDFYADCKIRTMHYDRHVLFQYICHQKWFSIDDVVANDTMIEALELLFPLKTKFEL